MKIDRALLSSTCVTRDYLDFWDPVSAVWSEVFGIRPILAFLGTHAEMEAANLSQEHGDIVRLDVVPGMSLRWQATWALFYVSRFVPQEQFCITMGIEEIPISKNFIRYIGELPDDAYFCAFGDGRWREGEHTIPSAWHCAQARLFSEVYQFEASFEAEIYKLDAKRNIYPNWESAPLAPGSDKWGMDETWSTSCLRNSNAHVVIHPKLIMKFDADLNRLSREDIRDHTYTIKDMAAHRYMEAQLPKPYASFREQNERLFAEVREANT